MAKKYSNNSKTGLRVFCVVLALILAAACTLGGLELFAPAGKKIKPSEWGTSDDLAPVTISFADDAPAPFGVTQTFENGARAYALPTPDSYPSTKRATATCTLPEGGAPDRYEWEIQGGEGLSVKTATSDGSIADVTAQAYFMGTATLTARAYRGNELRGVGSVGVRALPPEPEPEPLPAVSLVLFDIRDRSARYQYDIEEFKKEVLPSIAEDIDFKEISTDINDATIRSRFEELTISEADIAVIFDSYGIIANAITSFDLLAESGIAFIVIDNMPYEAEKVEAAGGMYMTAEGYDAGDARAVLDGMGNYGEEIALTWWYPGGAETEFDAFIGELFDDTAQNFEQDEIETLYEEYADSYDVIVCVPDGNALSNVVQSLYNNYGEDAPMNITWIVGDYYSGSTNEPQDQFYNDYPNLGGALVYQRQLNTDGIINAIIGTINGDEISDCFAYNRIRILP